MEKAIPLSNISVAIIDSFGWGTCHSWALPSICKPLKTKYTRSVSNTLCYPSTTLSCQKSEC
ncbi:hypothetical protein NQ318_018344 [Aromia moschata]|uniref:Uncharacterized protein n=1 Tax=Aromia moschata TaxID=1265417 RepID=A0AAV8ZEK5_9CUCU|nr:hypothetical protein NQ318_018344 [Aromia moschata]